MQTKPGGDLERSGPVELAFVLHQSVPTSSATKFLRCPKHDPTSRVGLGLPVGGLSSALY